MNDEGTFESGGVRLFWRSWRPAASPRAVLVLVHGLRDHSGLYETLAGELVAEGIAVYAHDLRGHGKSEGRPVYTPSFEQYGADLEKFFEQVRAREGRNPDFLMGHSMGGAIATLYVLNRKPALRGLLLSAPALKPGKEVSRALIAITRFLGGVLPGLPVLKLKPEDFSRDPEVVRANRTDPLIHQKPGPARTAAALLGALTEIQARMEEVEVPLLLLHGTADKVTEPSGSEALSKRARSKDVTWKSYPGFFHDLVHEPEGAQVRGDIRAWLVARLPEGSRGSP
jgi:alpha-beta hydrolase superfamily lysophospholipase